MPCRSERAGYVLPMTLLLIAIVATSMASLALKGLRATTRAAAARDDLQRRWAVISCRHAMLQMTDRLLDGAAVRERDAVASVRTAVQLGGHRVSLVIGDEQAKVNVNALRRRLGDARTEEVLGELVRGLDNDFAPVNGTCGSFSDVFDRPDPASLVGNAEEPGVAADLTCWGDGRVNIARATDAVMRAAFAGILKDAEVEKVIDIRRAQPGMPLTDVLNKLALDYDVRLLAQRLFTDGTHCKSVWIVCDDGRRQWYHLTVESAETGGRTLSVDFEW